MGHRHPFRQHRPSSNGGDERIGAYNRGNAGSGHGWSGAYQVFYNCLGDNFKVDSPPHTATVVLNAGEVRPGEAVSVELPPQPHRPLQPV